MANGSGGLRTAIGGKGDIHNAVLYLLSDIKDS